MIHHRIAEARRLTLFLRPFHRAGICRLALVCATVAGFVLALVLAASPELHQAAAGKAT